MGAPKFSAGKSSSAAEAEDEEEARTVRVEWRDRRGGADASARVGARRRRTLAEPVATMFAAAALEAAVDARTRYRVSKVQRSQVEVDIEGNGVTAMAMGSAFEKACNWHSRLASSVPSVSAQPARTEQVCALQSASMRGDRLQTPLPHGSNLGPCSLTEAI